MDLERAVGRAIKLYRERAGLTQAALAEMVEVSEQYVSTLERGARAPSFGTLARLSVALRAPVRDFFPGAAAAAQDDETLAAVVALLEPLNPEDRARALRVLRGMFS